MGKARHGKKSWRKNISTSDIDALVERSGREERTGVAELKAATDDALFFVDKSGDATVEKKTDRFRNMVLHCDSALQRSSLVPPVSSTKAKKKLKLKDFAKPSQKSLTVASKQEEPSKKPSKKRALEDVWAEANQRKLKKKITKTEIAPAVEVDLPGCSYNPTFEDHQDALGLAVAQEMQHVYKHALQPQAPPKSVLGAPIDEEEGFFLEADDNDMAEENEGDFDCEIGVSRPVKVKKLTRPQLNKKARRRLVLKEEAEKQRLAKLEEELQRVSEIREEIQEDDEEKEKLLARRSLARKERLESAPPKLGRHKFKPEPIQVLLSEEVTGSLRKLKGYHSLLRERYKSFQRRGLVEPRVAVKRSISKKNWVAYVPGCKGMKERASHEAMQLEREARKKAQSLVPVSTEVPTILKLQ